MVTRNGRPSRIFEVEFYSAERDAELCARMEVEPDGIATVLQAWAGKGDWRAPAWLTPDEDRRARELATEE